VNGEELPPDELEFSPKEMKDFVYQSMKWGWLFQLQNLCERYGYDVSASIDRIGSRYVHSKTVRPDVQLSGRGEDPETGEVDPAVEAKVESLVNQLEDELKEFVESFSNTIYKILESEYDGLIEAGEDTSDSYWSEYILEEGKKGLERIGFSDPEISFSGFGSQGDGASFTSKYLDLSEFTQAAQNGQVDSLAQQGYLD